MPLLSIEALDWRDDGPRAAFGLVADRAFQDAVEEDRRTLDEAHRHFRELADGWTGREVASICFKSAGIPPSFPYTSENIDILIQPDAAASARQTLLELGYVELRNIEEHQKWMFRLFEAGSSRSAIHLHTRVGWGQGFMLEPEIWRRRRQAQDDVFTGVPGPEDVVLINVAHALYENKEIGLHDVAKVRAAIRDGVDWEYIDYVAEERGWRLGLWFGLATIGRLERETMPTWAIDERRFEQVVSGVQESRYGRYWREVAERPARFPMPLSFVMTKTMFFEKVWSDRRVRPLAKPSIASLALIRGIKGQLGAHPQNSWLVTLSGLDGSGKTRQANALKESFDVAELRSRVMWARLGATPLMHRLSLTYRRRLAPVEREGEADGQSANRTREGWSLAPWAGMSAADFALWLLRVRWRLLRGDIVIADRYLPDFKIELYGKAAECRQLSALLLRVLDIVAPNPDQAFLLDLEGTLAHGRADFDRRAGDPAAEMMAYRRLARERGLTVIDASEPFETVSRRLAHEVLSGYLARYGTLGNLLFFSNPWQLNR